MSLFDKEDGYGRRYVDDDDFGEMAECSVCGSEIPLELAEEDNICPECGSRV